MRYGVTFQDRAMCCVPGTRSRLPCRHSDRGADLRHLIHLTIERFFMPFPTCCHLAPRRSGAKACSNGISQSSLSSCRFPLSNPVLLILYVLNQSCHSCSFFLASSNSIESRHNRSGTTRLKPKSPEISQNRQAPKLRAPSLAATGTLLLHC